MEKTKKKIIEPKNVNSAKECNNRMASHNPIFTVLYWPITSVSANNKYRAYRTHGRNVQGRNVHGRNVYGHLYGLGLHVAYNSTSSFMPWEDDEDSLQNAKSLWFKDKDKDL